MSRCRLEQREMDEAHGCAEYQRYRRPDLPPRPPGRGDRAAGEPGRAAAEDDRDQKKTAGRFRCVEGADIRQFLPCACSMPAAFEIGRRISGRSSNSRPSAERDQAVDHDIAAMRELERVIGILLDQEHGQPCRAVESRMASNICRTISGARPSEGSSSSNRRGRAISARRDRQHLLLAARQRAAALAHALSQAREQREHALEILAKSAGSATTAPICRFSSTVMREKMRRPSGACAMLSARSRASAAA